MIREASMGPNVQGRSVGFYLEQRRKQKQGLCQGHPPISQLRLTREQSLKAWVGLSQLPALTRSPAPSTCYIIVRHVRVSDSHPDVWLLYNLPPKCPLSHILEHSAEQ